LLMFGGGGNIKTHVLNKLAFFKNLTEHSLDAKNLNSC